MKPRMKGNKKPKGAKYRPPVRKRHDCRDHGLKMDYSDITEESGAHFCWACGAELNGGDKR